MPDQPCAGPSPATQIDVSLGVCRLQLDGSLAAGNRFVRFTLLSECDGEVVVGQGIIWVDMDRTPVGGNRILEFALEL